MPGRSAGAVVIPFPAQARRGVGPVPSPGPGSVLGSSRSAGAGRGTAHRGAVVNGVGSTGGRPTRVGRRKTTARSGHLRLTRRGRVAVALLATIVIVVLAAAI